MNHHPQTPPADRDRLIPLPEALAMLGISKSSAYRMLERQELPQPVKIGTRSFFSERELQDWIADKLAMRGREGRDE